MKRKILFHYQVCPFQIKKLIGKISIGAIILLQAINFLETIYLKFCWPFQKLFCDIRDPM